jgi:hypothetical protein
MMIRAYPDYFYKRGLSIIRSIIVVVQEDKRPHLPVRF